MFLRGLDPGGNVDPERKNKAPGHKQQSALKRHGHLMFVKEGRDGNGDLEINEKTHVVHHRDRGGEQPQVSYLMGFPSDPYKKPDVGRSGEYGESGETRPMNVAVHFIIKY